MRGEAFRRCRFSGIITALIAVAVRYHLLRASLRASSPLKKFTVCLALLLGSYVVAALTNASPITQDPLSRGRSDSRVVVVAPSAQEQQPAEAPVEAPALLPEAPAESSAEALHSL